MTSVNARLNGCENLFAVAGQAYEPVSRQRFDQIVSNPPFVISPESRFLYRDSGLQADAFCRELLRGAPDLLVEGGFCQMSVNWAHVEGQPWEQRLAEWFDELAADVLIWKDEVQSPEQYASLWIRSSPISEDQYHALHEEWMRFFAAEHIEAVGYGIVHMRRRTPDAGAVGNWLCIDESPDRVVGYSGEPILQRFAVEDLLRSSGADDGLLDVPLRLSPDARVVQTLRPREGEFVIEKMLLRSVRGLVREAYFDDNIATLIRHWSESATPRQLFERFAAAANTTVEALARSGLPIVRELLRKSYLVVAAAGESKS
jgi:hypothetical protein